MKRRNFLTLLLLLIVLPMTIACSSKDDENDNTPIDIESAVGTWMCIQSTDTYQGVSHDGLLVGKEITINKNGTYTSTSSDFGYSGTFTIDGNKITAKSKSGSTFVVTVVISGNKMTWNGTASNGVNFRYVFQKET